MTWLIWAVLSALFAAATALLAKAGVAFTASFGATAKSSPGSFGIQISYTPTPSQPPVLPNSSPVSLKSGVIVLA